MLLSADALGALLGVKTDEEQLGALVLANALVNLEILARDKRKKG